MKFVIQRVTHASVKVDGEIVGKGTHDELLKTCGIYKEIYSSQYGKEENNA